MKESQRDKPRCSSQIDLYQNCTKTLCNCTLGAYFEREADSPKLLKTLKRRTKEGIFGRDERACKAGELHRVQRSVQPLFSRFLESVVFLAKIAPYKPTYRGLMLPACVL